MYINNHFLINDMEKALVREWSHHLLVVDHFTCYAGKKHAIQAARFRFRSAIMVLHCAVNKT